jgi:hypothetical protein
MLTVRLLTQGANGDVVADGVFDPPTGAGRSPASVPPERLPSEARDTTAILLSSLADSALMVPNDTGTARREAAVDSAFLPALNGGVEVAAPLAFGGPLSAQSALGLSSPSKLLAISPVVGPAPVRAPRAAPDWTESATNDDFWAGVFICDMVNS